MIHIYAEKVVNSKALSDHTSLTQLVADHTMMHCCSRLSVEKSFPSQNKMTTTLCKWEETSPSPGWAFNGNMYVKKSGNIRVRVQPAAPARSSPPGPATAKIYLPPPRSGQIVLSHKSSNPYDRPSLRQILDAAADKTNP